MLKALRWAWMDRPCRMETSSRRTPGSRARETGWMPAYAGMTISRYDGMSAFQSTSHALSTSFYRSSTCPGVPSAYQDDMITVIIFGSAPVLGLGECHCSHRTRVVPASPIPPPTGTLHALAQNLYPYCKRGARRPSTTLQWCDALLAASRQKARERRGLEPGGNRPRQQVQYRSRIMRWRRAP